MASARRPSSSPARSHPSLREQKATGELRALCGELQLIAKTLGLPPLVRPNSGELVWQINSAARQGKLRKPIQDGRGATLCTALVHASFKLMDPCLVYDHSGTLPRSVVLKAMRDSEEVRILLQLLQTIQQESGACLVFEKARLAIDKEFRDDGRFYISLTEFEAHFEPAPMQRKPRPLGGLLTGLSLSVVQVIAVYVIAAHAGLVARPTLADLRSAGPHAAAAFRSALDLGAASAVQLGAGGGGSASVYTTAAAARASVYTDPNPAKEEEKKKKSDDAAADPDSAASLSWADGVTVGIKSDDTAAAAAPGTKDGPVHDGWSTKEGHHVPHTRLTSQEAAKQWAHDGAHSKRLLAEHKAKLAKTAAAAAATATAAKKGGKGAQEKATAKQKSAAAAAAAEPGADSLSWAEEGGPLVPPPSLAAREAQDARAKQAKEKAAAKAGKDDPGGPPHPGGADSLSWSEAISAQDERAAHQKVAKKEKTKEAKEEKAKAQLQQLKAEKVEEKKQLLLLKEEALLLKAEAKAQEEKAEAKAKKAKAKAKAKAEAMGWRWGGEGDGGDAKAKAEEARKDGKGTQETPATQKVAKEEKAKEEEAAKEEKEHQEMLKEIQKDREKPVTQGRQGRGGGAAGGSDMKEVPTPSRAEMAEHQNARKEKAKQGGEGKQKKGPKSKEDMVRRFAEAAAEEEADLSREELTGRLKEVRSSTTPVTCAPRPVPVPTLVPTQPQPCPLGDGGGRHRQDAGDARKRAGLRRGGHGRDQGQG